MKSCNNSLGSLVSVVNEYGRKGRAMTDQESMRNLVHRHNGTSMPGIAPRRLAILSILQSVRPTTFADDQKTYEHFRRPKQPTQQHKETMNTTTTPRIYVACKASYDSGTLYGGWIDDCTDADAIRDSVAAILRASRFPSAEEWAIHDYEGFYGIKLEESHDINELAELAKLIKETADDDLMRAAIAVSDDTDPDTLREMLQDRYQGCYDSLAEWAESLCEDIYADSLAKLPPFIRNHIDWEYVAENELIMGGDYVTTRVNGSEYIFRNN